MPTAQEFPMSCCDLLSPMASDVPCHSRKKDGAITKKHEARNQIRPPSIRNVGLFQIVLLLTAGTLALRCCHLTGKIQKKKNSCHSFFFSPLLQWEEILSRYKWLRGHAFMRRCQGRNTCPFTWKQKKSKNLTARMNFTAHASKTSFTTTMGTFAMQH